MTKRHVEDVQRGSERCWSCGRFMRMRVEVEADGSWARTVWWCTNSRCPRLDGDY